MLTTTTQHKYNHLLVGDPENYQAYTVCGAKTTKSPKYKHCQKPAGWGTDHVGEGRCRKHGGLSLRGPAQPQFKHGKQAYAWRALMDKQWAKLDQVQADDLSLVRELTTLRLLMAVQLERLYGGDGGGGNGGGGLLLDGVSEADGVVDRGDRTNEEERIPRAHPRPAKPQEIPELEDALRETVADIGKTVKSIVDMRNSTALTAADIRYLGMVMEEFFDKYVPREDWTEGYEYLRKRLSLSMGRVADIVGEESTS